MADKCHGEIYQRLHEQEGAKLQKERDEKWQQQKSEQGVQSIVDNLFRGGESERTRMEDAQGGTLNQKRPQGGIKKGAG